MRCPYCGGLDTQVKDSRPSDDSSAIRRRRICPDCGGRFTTFERVQLRELIVVKRSGRKVPFDRDKLQRSVETALRKRPVEAERIERLVSGITRRLESTGEAEVTSEAIGEAVMEGLKGLDDVAYVRFASVYKNFARPATSRNCSATSPPAPPRRPPPTRLRQPKSRCRRPGARGAARREYPRSRPGGGRPALHAPRPRSRPASSRPGLAEPVGGRGAGRRPAGLRADSRPGRDASGRPAPCRAGGARGGRGGGARRHPLRHARTLLASRPHLALRRRHHRGRRHQGGERHGRSRSPGRRPRPCPLAEAGISVSVGLMGPEAARDQRGHVTRICKADRPSSSSSPARRTALRRAERAG